MVHIIVRLSCFWARIDERSSHSQGGGRHHDQGLNLGFFDCISSALPWSHPDPEFNCTTANYLCLGSASITLSSAPIIYYREVNDHYYLEPLQDQTPPKETKPGKSKRIEDYSTRTGRFCPRRVWRIRLWSNSFGYLVLVLTTIQSGCITK